MSIRVACFGDICGEAGRKSLVDYLEKHRGVFDFVIANGENSAHGFGITQRICDQLFSAGVNVITLGNHTFDLRNDLQMFNRNKNLVRPLNYPKGTPGHGFVTCQIPTGKKITVINLIGRVFMELNDDPFSVVNEFLNVNRLGTTTDVIVIDFHAETSSEKIALGYYLDGRVSGVYGTHTHMPTADARILPNGTGFLTDCGMCGDYNSVIGMEKSAPVLRLTDKINAHARMTPATNMNTSSVCGVAFDIDNGGKCIDIQTIRMGGNFLREQKDYIKR